MSIVITDNVGATSKLTELDNNGQNPQILVADMGGNLYSDLLRYDSITEYFFWVVGGNIRKCDRNGNNVTTIIDEANTINSIGLDSVNSKIYYGVVNPSAYLRRADFDGSNKTTILSSVIPNGITLEPINSKIYFSQQNVGGDKIRRCDYNGENLIDLVSGISAQTVQCIELNLSADKLYYVTSEDYIYQVPINGGSPSILYDSPSTLLTAFDIDIAGGKIYIIEASPSAVKKANLSDGGDVETLYDGATQPISIAILDMAPSASSIDTSGNLISCGHQYMATYWCSENWSKRIK